MTTSHRKIYVLCNPAMISLYKPLAWSKIVDWYDRTACVALYWDNEVMQISGAQCDAMGAWWREIGISNLGADDLAKYKPRTMRRMGIFEYIEENWGATTENNVAAVIGSIAALENKNPTELFDTL